MGSAYSIAPVGNLLMLNLKQFAPGPMRTSAILSTLILAGQKPIPIGPPEPIPLYDLAALGVAMPKQLVVRVDVPGGIQNLSLVLLNKNTPVFMTKPMALPANQSGSVFSLDAQAQTAALPFWNPSNSLAAIGEPANGIIAILIGL